MLAACVVVFGVVGSAMAQTKEERLLHNRFTLSMAIGSWQPHSLNDEPRFNTFGAAGATPFVNLSFLIPLKGGSGLCVSAGFWALRDLDEVEPVHSLTLLPLSVGFKYRLVPENRLSAYVQYGAGFYWGIENVAAPLEKINEARNGMGLHLGAGFDFILTDWLGIGVAFQYVYMVFKEPLGGVEDFSGPRITSLIHFLL